MLVKAQKNFVQNLRRELDQIDKFYKFCKNSDLFDLLRKMLHSDPK